MKKTKILAVTVFAVLLLCTGPVFAKMPCWMQEMAGDTGSIGTELGEKSQGEVMDIEDAKAVRESDTAMGWVYEKAATDTALGSFFREMAGLPNPFTYNQPKTGQFFNGIDSVATGSEMEKIKAIYNATAEAIPRGGAPGNNSNDLGKLSTFEETLTAETGWCRDQAMLLNTALQKHGIDSEIVSGTITSNGMGHMWVRVTISDSSSPNYGKQFDLDSMWYKDFAPLPIRDGSGGGNGEDDCGEGGYYCGCNDTSYDDFLDCLSNCHANMSCFEAVCSKR